MIKVEIDNDSGFCFGVTAAINKAEAELAKQRPLYCLGDIVHNSDEVERLRSKGLVTITHADLENLHNVSVLLRAHGEPPSTYEIARRNGIRIIDATCPVVLQLQRRINSAYHSSQQPPQIVIYGKAGHAEVNGLVGQTDGTALVVEDSDSLNNIDFNKPIALYSQTTKSLDGYRNMCNSIAEKAAGKVSVSYHDTICRQVANRAERLSEFARSHSVALFVCGKKSSNGRVLYGHCKDANPNTHLIENATEIDPAWLQQATSIGICGATSTPRWLMEDVRDTVQNILKNQK
ncbi:MAG: 4-hydroxy-3-methylbut-2-enyl diphosphate reductase [Firmicutes bacterium]|nr:4-hydroxy-3-methylbut-2-enyl diphosphate reductase [Bacillota bacterium]MCM1401106.1 4-hydroxy-3-methylbut-2-enyl diphosphate reductase [Bacteroides sp.]MCM1477071.1 4-hydroxy-3-methylbut-2-enyl diphosphate reductase [Bacteroides sp.]